MKQTPYCILILKVLQHCYCKQRKYCGDCLVLNYLLVFAGDKSSKCISFWCFVGNDCWDSQIQGSYPFLNKNFKDILRTPISAKKSLKCTSFLVVPQQEQFYPEGLSVFAGLDKVSIKSPGLSSTDCKFQGLSRGLEFLF